MIMKYIVMKIFLSEAFLVFVFTTLGFPEVRLFGMSPQMVLSSVSAASTGNVKDQVSIHSLSMMFIFTSFVNLIGQMVCNYFNCMYSILNAVANFPKCLFTNCISFCESLVPDPHPLFSDWLFAVKLTLCMRVYCNYMFFTHFL